MGAMLPPTGDGINRTRPAPNGDGPSACGWLFVLCGLLLVVEPLGLGLSAARLLQAAPLRGGAFALTILLRILVAGLGIAAGLALRGRRPGAVALARAALMASLATAVLIGVTPSLGLNRRPGDTLPNLVLSVAYHVGWLLYLSRSARVRRTYLD